MLDAGKKTATFTGLAFAIFVLLGNGFQPIINNARPGDLEDLLFTFMTIVIELTTILPVAFLEQKIARKPIRQIIGTRAAWKCHWLWFVAIGIIFAFSTYFIVIGLSSTDSITGAVSLRTMPISAVVIGYFFLKEKITRYHIACIAVMCAAIFFVATKGTWQAGVISPGIVLLLIAPVLWSIGHALSKRMLMDHDVTASQMIVIRTTISGSILGIFYMIGTGGSSAWQIAEPTHFLFMFLMGANYTMLHYCWYRAIMHLDLNIATAISIPSPLITALLAAAFLGESLQWYHVVGIIVAFVALYGLLLADVKKKRPLSSSGKTVESTRAVEEHKLNDK
nr:DMT family transporter [Candidatus Sigynarchaeota archaeon]